MDKLFKTVSVKAVDEIEGKVEAVFSNFNEVDSDGDVVLPNSIKSGYGDKGVAMVWAHDWKRVIGRGDIVDDGEKAVFKGQFIICLLYTSPSPRDLSTSRMPSSA